MIARQQNQRDRAETVEYLSHAWFNSTTSTVSTRNTETAVKITSKADQQLQPASFAALIGLPAISSLVNCMAAISAGIRIG